MRIARRFSAIFKTLPVQECARLVAVEPTARREYRNVDALEVLGAPLQSAPERVQHRMSHVSLGTGQICAEDFLRILQGAIAFRLRSPAASKANVRPAMSPSQEKAQSTLKCAADERDFVEPIACRDRRHDADQMGGRSRAASHCAVPR